MSDKDVTIVKDGEKISIAIQKTSIERQFLNNLSIEKFYELREAINAFAEQLINKGVHDK